MSEPICLRCGRCCILVVDGGKSTVKCPHLVRLSKDTTVCRVYHNRLNVLLPHHNHCILRINDKHNYPGCRFNKPEYKYWEDEHNGMD